MRRILTWLLTMTVIAALTGCTSNEASDTANSPSPVSSPDVSPFPSPSPTSNARVVTVTIAGENIDVSETRVEASLNELIRIEVTSDREEELHVHGYELKTDIKPGEPAVLQFAADLQGVFEVELEKGHDKLFELRVS